MAAYDSDSSGVEDVETGVTLGYTSKDPTGDDFSQLGGNPVCCRARHIALDLHIADMAGRSTQA